MSSENVVVQVEPPKRRPAVFLFDVDGTLTEPRQVGTVHLKIFEKKIFSGRIP